MLEDERWNEKGTSPLNHTRFRDPEEPSWFMKTKDRGILEHPYDEEKRRKEIMGRWKKMRREDIVIDDDDDDDVDGFMSAFDRQKQMRKRRRGEIKEHKTRKGNMAMFLYSYCLSITRHSRGENKEMYSCASATLLPLLSLHHHRCCCSFVRYSQKGCSSWTISFIIPIRSNHCTCECVFPMCHSTWEDAFTP